MELNFKLDDPNEMRAAAEFLQMMADIRTRILAPSAKYIDGIRDVKWVTPAKPNSEPLPPLDLADTPLPPETAVADGSEPYNTAIVMDSAFVPPEPKKRGRPRKIIGEDDAKKVEPDLVPAPEGSRVLVAEEPTPTLDDVENAVVAFIDRLGGKEKPAVVEKMRAILKQVDESRASELKQKPEKFARFIELLNQEGV